MKLYCVRHGEAESSAVNSSRPLTARGRLAVNQLADFLRKSKICVPHIMHSGKLRAQQTAEILMKGCHANQITACPALLDEDADIMPLLEMLPAWHEDVMLVGHLPFMNQLINTLLKRHSNDVPLVNFIPGAIVCLQSLPSESWIIDFVINPNFFTEVTLNGNC